MSLVREGLYRAEIASVEWKQTKAQTGHYLKLIFKIKNHYEFDGKTIHFILNLDNPNPVAIEFAHKAWKAICYCANLGEIQPPKSEPSVELKKNLLYAQLTIDLKHKPGTNGYTNYNITSFRPFDAPLTENTPSKLAVPKQDHKASPPREEAPPPDKDTSYYDDLNDDIPF